MAVNGTTKKQKVTGMTLSDEVVDWLDETGNRTAYVERIVAERRRLWRSSLIHLRTCATAWSGNELLAMCDLLNGTIVDAPGTALGDALRVEMQFADEIVAKWKIDPARWAELARGVADDVTARAIVAIAAEYWSGNEMARREIGSSRG